MTKFLLYTCRHGDEKLLFPHTEEAWNYIIEILMPRCNGMTMEEMLDEGYDVEDPPDFYTSVSPRFSIDDGGFIETIELSELTRYGST